VPAAFAHVREFLPSIGLQPPTRLMIALLQRGVSRLDSEGDESSREKEFHLPQHQTPFRLIDKLQRQPPLQQKRHRNISVVQLSEMKSFLAQLESLPSMIQQSSRIL
jgi:hypothetical protein